MLKKRVSVIRIVLLLFLVGTPVFFIFFPSAQYNEISFGFRESVRDVLQSLTDYWDRQSRDFLLGAAERQLKMQQVQAEQEMRERRAAIEQAAEAGSVPKMYQMVIENKGDLAKVVYWYKRAAEADLDKTQEVLCYPPVSLGQVGPGVPFDCRRHANGLLVEVLSAADTFPEELVSEMDGRIYLLGLMPYELAEAKCAELGAELPSEFQFVQWRRDVQSYFKPVVFARNQDKSPILCGNDYRLANEPEWRGEARRYNLFWVKNEPYHYSIKKFHSFNFINALVDVGDRARVVCVKKEYATAAN